MVNKKRMTADEINEVYIYMQLYDKMVISKKTLLNKLNINFEEEEKQIEKEKNRS